MARLSLLLALFSTILLSQYFISHSVSALSLPSFFQLKERQFLRESTIEDTSITLSHVAHQNTDYFFPVLNDLVKTKFFKIFKVNLASECPFWAMEKVCKSEGGCSVCKCDADDVPLSWQITKKNRVNTFLGQEVKPRKWVDNQKDSWFPESQDSDYTYVNLLLNPETNTGYDGKEASKIWMTIYRENCFHGGNVENMCLEERIFYRLLSGVHMTITTKIAAYFYKNLDYEELKPATYTYDMYLPNLPMFEHAVMPFPERVQNMFFLYSFTLRAMQKARNFLLDYEYITDDVEQDARTKHLIQELLNKDVMQISPGDELNDTSAGGSCCFDESCLFKAQCYEKQNSKELVLDQMRSHFRNVSMLMDCVGCEKCKMWAKLQMLGLSVALRIVTADTKEELDRVTSKLSRNEIIAFINSFKQQSQSIEELDTLYQKVWRKRVSKNVSYAIVTAIVLTLLRVIYVIVSSIISKKRKRNKAKAQ
mmetsp:Transcript_11332/g.42475  ORF Transcript_11332/g.42475 Transcript_11332/m.42475 type:complete len:480 (-) Transcript_11332:93-1532(-)|eukprot:CAMPEP_0117456554 /NCGR_PEP_ID=MMETSP0759-20121206/11938_1 /TAXON_ID=63605 /ORGANISM="Percolomonas cosmopolitus, Strain WS" /LENGTH=479 /DNA_ID=CAMNT_0005249899 /DNA_START=249 /DNA_END=1688 /DNA_ORIENTATION=-